MTIYVGQRGIYAPIILEFREIEGANFYTATLSLIVTVTPGAPGAPSGPSFDLTSWTWSNLSPTTARATTVLTGSEFPTAGIYSFNGVLTINSDEVDLVRWIETVRDN